MIETFKHKGLRQLHEKNDRSGIRPDMLDKVQKILSALEANELDLGVLCTPPRLPRTLSITHRFTDAFALLASAEKAIQFESLPKSKAARLGLVAKAGLAAARRNHEHWCKAAQMDFPIRHKSRASHAT